MQASVTVLNKGRNAAGVCDKRSRRVILETVVREEAGSHIEIKT